MRDIVERRSSGCSAWVSRSRKAMSETRVEKDMIAWSWRECEAGADGGGGGGSSAV